MILLTEWMQGIEFLTEDTKSGKTMYIEGPMIQTETKNRNNRIYPKAIMEKSVDKYIKEYVNERRALGEATHPDRPFANLKEAALIIESLSWHGNNVVGKARILNNPNGTILKSLAEANFNMGMSTRGLGEVSKRPSADLVNNYLLTAIDAVDMPSGQACYVNAMNESLEWVFENGIWVEKANKEKGEQLFFEKFETLMNNIRKGIK
jgi:hypothetical protein